MKRTLTWLAALAAVVCFASSAAAQELVRVYTPESIPYIGTTTDFGYGVAPVYRAANYAPVARPRLRTATTTLLRAPATTTYYAPSPTTTSYYAPSCRRPRTTLRRTRLITLRLTTAYYAPATTSVLCSRAAAVAYMLRLLRSGLLRPCVLLRSGSAGAGPARTQRVPRHDLVSLTE